MRWETGRGRRSVQGAVRPSQGPTQTPKPPGNHLASPPLLETHFFSGERDP